MKVPCKNCEERCKGCHSRCVQYKEYCTQNEELKARKRKIADDYWYIDHKGGRKIK